MLSVNWFEVFRFDVSRPQFNLLVLPPQSVCMIVACGNMKGKAIIIDSDCTAWSKVKCVNCSDVLRL